MKKNLLIWTLGALVLFLLMLLFLNNTSELHPEEPQSAQFERTETERSELNSLVEEMEDEGNIENGEMVDQEKYMIEGTNVSFALPSEYSPPTYNDDPQLYSVSKCGDPVQPDCQVPVAVYSSSGDNLSDLTLEIYQSNDFNLATSGGFYNYKNGIWSSSNREVTLLPSTNILHYSMGDAGGYRHGVAVPDAERMVVISFSGDTNESGHQIYEGIDGTLNFVTVN